MYQQIICSINILRLLGARLVKLFLLVASLKLIILMGYSYAAISLTSTLKWSGSRPTGAAQGDPSEFN
jgi:hypothetical protein